MVQRPGIDWQKPASRVDSTPFFLAAQRRTASTVKKKLLFTLARKYTRVCGPLCDPNGSNQATPALSSASTVLGSTLVLGCNCKPVCSLFNDQPAEQQTWQSLPPQGIFALQKSLRRVGFHKFVVPPTSNRSKVRNNSRLVRCPYRAAPGSLRGSSPSVWERVQRKPFSRVFFGQLLLDGRRRSSLRS